MCAQLHFNICKEIGVKLDKEYWHDHVPKSVETSHDGKDTILWNQQVRSDRIIPNNQPDIIIRDNNDRGDWNHFRITQTIPEQHTRQARN